MTTKGTLGDIFNRSEEFNQELIEKDPVNETVSEEPKVQQPIPEQVEEAKPVVVEEKRDDVDESIAPSFQFGEAAEEVKPAETIQEQPTTINWKDAIKSVPKEELLAELGIEGLDEFTLEFAKARKNGVDPYKYLEAKAVDYTKINDFDLVRKDFEKKYQHLEAADRDYLFNKKYVAGEFDEEDAVREKSIALKADAFETRQRLIAEQQSFKIPDVAQSSNEPTAQQLAEIEQENQKAQAAYNRFMEHDATKNLMTSKRVAVNVGEGLEPFKFPVDNPQALLNVILDANTWQKVISNGQGEPDPIKLQRLSLVAVNPNYEKDLVNYGRSLERKAIISADQNARKPNGASPANYVSKEVKITKSGGTIATMGR